MLDVSVKYVNEELRYLDANFSYQSQNIARNIKWPRKAQQNNADPSKAQLVTFII